MDFGKDDMEIGRIGEWYKYDGKFNKYKKQFSRHANHETKLFFSRYIATMATLLAQPFRMHNASTQQRVSTPPMAIPNAQKENTDFHGGKYMFGYSPGVEEIKAFHMPPLPAVPTVAAAENIVATAVAKRAVTPRGRKSPAPGQLLRNPSKTRLTPPTRPSSAHMK